MRKLMKNLCLISFNTFSNRGVKSAVREDQKDKLEDYPPRHLWPNLNEIMANLQEYHEPIAKYFLSNIGKKLQNVDSRIAEYVMKKMTVKGIPVLSIHDSFICEEENEKLLKELMVEGYQKITKQEWGYEGSAPRLH